MVTSRNVHQNSEIVKLLLNINKGWDKSTAKEVIDLIRGLTPEEVVTRLKSIDSLKISLKDKNIGRPKAYRIAWIKLQNNLITLEEFETIIHRQLIATTPEKRISKDTYYRALRNARKFIKLKEKISKNITLRSYEEIWIAFQANRIDFKEFKINLNQLKENGKITEKNYSNALEKGEKILKIQRHMVDMTNKSIITP